MWFFDPMYFVFIAPALILGLWAQMRIKATYATAQKMAAPLSGAAAARHILDSAGLQSVDVEQIPGHLSDHYDPRQKVLRLSPEVYQSRSLAAVGIAAHEAGHALQDAKAYGPLVIRNMAVPAASFGSNAAFILVMIGLFVNALSFLALLGILLFACVVFFQVVNLPVEFNASSRARGLLVSSAIIIPAEERMVGKVLSAAAMTYVAATIVAIMQMLYFAYLIFGRRN